MYVKLSLIQPYFLVKCLHKTLKQSKSECEFFKELNKFGNFGKIPLIANFDEQYATFCDTP